jgi:hypothetical protein|tara:strand:- start:158 stop:466 length:309 start_codon:yes stop_codon:yes gene_type:complete
MPNTFKNYTSTSVGTGATTVYTVPSATVAVTVGLNIANVTANQITVDVQAAGAYLIKDTPIPAGAGLSVLDGKIILETTDTLIVTTNTASSADVILSVLEQS